MISGSLISALLRFSPRDWPLAVITLVSRRDSMDFMTRLQPSGTLEILHEIPGVRGLDFHDGWGLLADIFKIVQGKGVDPVRGRWQGNGGSGWWSRS